MVGSCCLPRNLVVVRNAAVGGWLYSTDPVRAFTAAPLAGLVGVASVLVRGSKFEAYR